VEWLKVKALSSSPPPTKEKKKVKVEENKNRSIQVTELSLLCSYPQVLNLWRNDANSGGHEMLRL
jgi:hypothetical protein